MVRKEANRALKFMIDEGFADNDGFVKSLDSFSRFNLENWFVQPQRALYNLYALVDTLPKLPTNIAESYLELLPTILEGRSTHELKAMVAQVIENLFATKHLQSAKTKALLIHLLGICSEKVPESGHPIEVTSLVQCLTQVYLNYNAGIPTFAKELLPKVLDVLTEILALTPEEITQFDVPTLRLIKDRVTRNIELALIMSCDEYLFPSDEGLDFIGALTIDEPEGSLFANFSKNHTSMNEEGTSLSAPNSQMIPRKRVFLILKDLLSSRFESSRVYVLNIIDSLTTKLGQDGLAKTDVVSEELITLFMEMRRNLGVNSLSEKCLGNIASKVNLELLLKKLPIDVTTVPLTSPDFDIQSNAFLLSLLSIYKPRLKFAQFFDNFWPQLLKLSQLVKQQALFKDSQHIDNVLLARLKSLENQYLTILKRSIGFNDTPSAQLPIYLKELLSVLLGLDDSETEKLAFFGEPLKFLFVAALAEKNNNPKLYGDVLTVVKELTLLPKMCKLMIRLDTPVPFVSDCIKLLVLMLDPQFVVTIVTKNVKRLDTYFSGLKDSKGDVFEKNLKDLDVLTTMVSVMRELQSTGIFSDLLALEKTLFTSESEKVWKRATILTQAILTNVHYTYAASVFEPVTLFFDQRMKAVKESQKNRKQAAAGVGAMADEKLNIRKIKHKLQGIVLRVAKDFVQKYFASKLEEIRESMQHKNKAGTASLEAFGEELQAFSDSYLPIAIVCSKHKSIKTRENVKAFILRLDEVYRTLTGDGNTMVSMVLAGLSGKSSLMKSATLRTALMLLEAKHESFEESFIEKVAEVVLILLKDRNNETFNAVIAFLKGYTKLVSQKALKGQLNSVLEAVYKFDSEAAKRNHKVVLNLIEKLVRKVGEEAVKKGLPEAEVAALRYIRRQDKRLSKMKAKKKAREFEDRLKSANRGIETVNQDALDLDPNLSRRARGRKLRVLAKEKETQKIMDQMMLVEGGTENTAEVEDLLVKFDSNKESFHFTKHHVFMVKAANKAQEAKAEEAAATMQGDIYFDERSGKLVIRDAEKKSLFGAKRKADALKGIGSDSEDSDDEETKKGPGKVKPKDKLRTDTKINPEEETLAAKVLKKHNMLRKKDNLHIVREAGDVYKAKGNTKGDVYIPGKAAPHAFIQLNPMALQKKNREKASEIFSYLVNRKKTGLLKGMISKTKK